MTTVKEPCELTLAQDSTTVIYTGTLHTDAYLRVFVNDKNCFLVGPAPESGLDAIPCTGVTMQPTGIHVDRITGVRRRVVAINVGVLTS